MAGAESPSSADEVARWLVGTYDTQDQAARDVEVPALLGVKRASSEIRVFSDRVETWDRGFGTRSVQLSGPRLGPYAWKKRSAVPEPER